MFLLKGRRYDKKDYVNGVFGVSVFGRWMPGIAKAEIFDRGYQKPAGKRLERRR
jgi:hypothetical protein